MTSNKNDIGSAVEKQNGGGETGKGNDAAAADSATGSAPVETGSAVAAQTDSESDPYAVISVIKRFTGRACFWAILYAIGYFKCHVIWALLPITAGFYLKGRLARQRERDKTRYRLKISDLPKWVFFPDADRVEWVNQIVARIWPHLQEYVTSLLETQAKNSSQWVKFYRTSLGTVSPQIGGIKVYQNKLSRNEIILDVDLVFASNCDIRVGVAPFLYASIRDLYMQGHLRIMLTPLLQDAPLVGGAHISLVNVPGVDFDLGGVANVADVPGISGLVRGVILDAVKDNMLLPKTIYVPFVDSSVLEDSSAHFTPLELIRLRVVRAKELLAKDIHFLAENSSDPFVVAKHSGPLGNLERTSDVVMKSLSPEWNMPFEFATEAKGDEKGGVTDDANAEEVQLDVWDWDKAKGNDFLGQVGVSINTIYKTRNTESWFPLQGVSSGRICLRPECLLLRPATFEHPADDYLEAEAKAEAEGEAGASRAHEWSRAVLQVQLDSCANLTGTKGRAPNSRVSLSVSGAGHDARESHVVPFTYDPIFKEEFNMLVRNPECDSFYVKVSDVKHNKEIGSLQLDLLQFVRDPGLGLKRQPYRLSNSANPNSHIILAVRLLYPVKEAM